MPPTNGLLETALYVSDAHRSQQFYERVFGFREIMREEGRLHALSIADRQVLLLFRKDSTTAPLPLPGGTIPPHGGHGKLHLAFAIDKSSVDAWRNWLRQLDIEIESEVDFPRGGHSIYFRDPDGHLVEVLTPGIWSIY